MLLVVWQNARFVAFTFEELSNYINKSYFAIGQNRVK